MGGACELQGEARQVLHNSEAVAIRRAREALQDLARLGHDLENQFRELKVAANLLRSALNNHRALGDASLSHSMATQTE